jgi:hypothetical protein
MASAITLDWSRGSSMIAIPFFLIISGVILLLDNLGMVTLRQVLDLWPLLLITAAVEELLTQRGIN